MQAAKQLDRLDQTATVRRAPLFRRAWIVLGGLVVLVLLALLPPYLNVNRYQRRIAQSISDSLGRPVHLDHVTLNLLPVPSLTLDRFVVSEDPAFGAEPTIRAESVRATLRVSTLWRRRIEIATISLTEPSVNLVHLPDGRWNLDSILLQTARLGSAPTQQRTAGPAPRFPYIEATGARVNLKLGQEKTPIALAEADFAMWLPQPERWNFRIKARPARTDVPLGYTGVLRLEGTVGRAPTFAAVPLDLRGEWRGVPLGEMSRILIGRDGGLRGDATVLASTQGTVGSNRVLVSLNLNGARRADFVPAHPLSITAQCAATVTNAFHGLTDARCRLPAQTDQTDQPNPALLTLSGTLDDIRRRDSAAGQMQLGPVPAANLLPLLHTLSARVPPGLALTGVVSGEAASTGGHPEATLLWEGGAVGSGPDAVAVGDVALRTPDPAAPRRRAAKPDPAPPDPASPALVLAPTTLALGGREPALLDGRIDLQGYTLHLIGSASLPRLRALAANLPQFGDGLDAALPESAEIVHLDLIATRTWAGLQSGLEAAPQTGPQSGQQVWRNAPPRPAAPRLPRRRHR